jgi:RNA-binding protein
MPHPLSNAEKNDLKARAQRLEPVLKIGHSGVTPAFLASLDAALTQHGLVKVRFTDFKEAKKTLAPQIAEQSGSTLIMRVGHVAVYYRPPGASSDRAAADGG